MESSGFEQDVVCPICKVKLPSLFDVTDAISTQDWKCMEAGCAGERRLHFGYCQVCGDAVVKPWRKDRTLIICEKCKLLASAGQGTRSLGNRQGEPTELSEGENESDARFATFNPDRDNAVMGRLSAIDGGIAGIAGDIQNLYSQLDEARGKQPVAEELTHRHRDVEQALGKLEKSLEHIKRGVESMNALIAKTQGYLREDLKSSDEQVLAHLKDYFAKIHTGTHNISKFLSELPVGKLTEDERRQLADVICNQLISSLSLTLLGKKKAKDSGELVPAYPDVSTMIRTHLDTLVNKPWKESIAKLEHKLVPVVVETAVETLGSARSRGKDERQFVLSLNLHAMQDFVDKVAAAKLTIVKHLPELFNRIEIELKYHQKELERAGDNGASRAVVKLLQAVDESFANWQRQNNIVRFPEKTGEAVIPRLHENVLTLPTDNRELHRLIGRVEQHGYLFQDNVDGEMILQKAAVAVWDFGKRE